MRLFFLIAVFLSVAFFVPNVLAQTQSCDLCQISGGECDPQFYTSQGECDTGMGFNGTCCVSISGGGNSGNDCQGGLCINDACPSNFPNPVKTCQTTNGMTGTCCMPAGGGGGTGGGTEVACPGGGACSATRVCSAPFSVSTTTACVVGGVNGLCCNPDSSSGGGPGAGGTSSPTGPVCPGRWEAGICFPNTTGLSKAPVYVILYNLVWWLLAILSFIGIIAFVISGMQYLLSAGNEETVKTAKNSMKYSIMGMVVALSGFVIILAIDAALRGFAYF